MLKKNAKIFLAGHLGLVGSSILKKLKLENYKQIFVVKKNKLNLLDQKKTFAYLKKIKPDLVINCAARVGGINAHQMNKSNFIYENIQIQNNLIHGSFLAGVKNLINLTSSCIYPEKSKIPIKESALLSGYLEKTNDAYAIAKISGLKMCQAYSENYKLNYKTLMACNLYGECGNYDLKKSQFYHALIKKIHLAKVDNKNTVEIWGSGLPKRELMHVEDAASAVIFFMNKKFKENFLNIGTKKDYSIIWYAKFIMKKLNISLKIKLIRSMPDGTYRKLLDSSIAYGYGWKPKINLNKGFWMTYDFLKKTLD